MLEHYLTLGGVEIANHTRLAAYLDATPVPDAQMEACGCETFTPDLVDDGPYTTPGQDPAPWFDPLVPASGEFLGLLVLSVEGLDTWPTSRNLTTRVAGGSAIGPLRQQSRSIVVTAVLLATTCCGASYGLRWLGQTLQGCGQPGCAGEDLSFFACCPDEPPADAEQFRERYRRTLRRVVLTDGPEVTARDGGSCGTCAGQMLTVTFTLTAATGWAWTDPLEVVDIPAPGDDGTECIAWCVHDDEGGPCPEPCRLAGCPNPTAACGDPHCTAPAPPDVALPQTCFCESLAVNRSCFELDLTDRPIWFDAAPIITVAAGAAPARRVTVSVYERLPEHVGLSCEEVAQAQRCHPTGVWHAAYVPAGGTLTFDGQIEQAQVACGGVVEQSADAWGPGGAPPQWALLGCGRSWCVCVESDAMLPAEDATVQIAVSGREW